MREFGCWSCNCCGCGCLSVLLPIILLPVLLVVGVIWILSLIFPEISGVSSNMHQMFELVSQAIQGVVLFG